MLSQIGNGSWAHPPIQRLPGCRPEGLEKRVKDQNALYVIKQGEWEGFFSERKVNRACFSFLDILLKEEEYIAPTIVNDGNSYDHEDDKP